MVNIFSFSLNAAEETDYSYLLLDEAKENYPYTAKKVEKRKRFLLITGCARSGTTFTSKFFLECGLGIFHEAIGPHGSASWLMAVKTKKCPWGDPNHRVSFQHIFHQVRDPLKVIASVYTAEPYESWKYICKHVPQIKMSDSKLLRSAKYWYYWNLKAERKAELTYRIEEIESVLDKMSRILKIPLDKSVLANIPKDINTRGNHYIEVTWEKLADELPSDLYKKIRRMAKRYGYL